MTDSDTHHPRFGGFAASRDGGLINRTELAFVTRGINTAKAAELRLAGWTFAKLQQAKDPELAALGLAPHVIENIRAESRPEIPAKTLMQVLVAERFTCTVCHDVERPVVVHHIVEWHLSHDHSAENLCLLCEIHHGQAHSRSTLTQSGRGRAPRYQSGMGG